MTASARPRHSKQFVVRITSWLPHDEDECRVVAKVHRVILVEQAPAVRQGAFIELARVAIGGIHNLVEALFGVFGKGVDISPLEGHPFDGVKAGITGFNAYYIFNHGRFSYPAAFSQSTIQKVSCGSWMAGLGYTKNTLELDYERLQQLIDSKMTTSIQLDSALMFRKVEYNDYSISGGYAYNWVFKKNWLFGASLQAAIAYKKSTGNVVGNSRGGFDFKNVNLDGIGRFGLVYNNMRWYAGASIIVHTNNYHKPRFRTNNTFGSMNVYVGYNFRLKKKYRKKK